MNKNNYGVLAFEDKYDDFVSVFWCSHVDDDGIIKVVERYQPEALVLKIDYDETIVYESSLRDKYRMIYTDKTYQFWMANRVL